MGGTHCSASHCTRSALPSFPCFSRRQSGPISPVAPRVVSLARGPVVWSFSLLGLLRAPLDLRRTHGCRTRRGSRCSCGLCPGGTSSLRLYIAPPSSLSDRKRHNPGKQTEGEEWRSRAPPTSSAAVTAVQYSRKDSGEASCREGPGQTPLAQEFGRNRGEFLSVAHGSPPVALHRSQEQPHRDSRYGTFPMP